MAYCTTAAVLDQVRGVDLAALGDASAQNAAVLAALEAAGREVDARCRRTFEPPTEPETRLLDGHAGFVLRVPDLVRLDSVTVDAVPAPVVHAYPLTGPPFLWIATGTRFPIGRGNVAVTGLWGYAATVPDDIARATACLAAAEILGRLQAFRTGGVRMAVAGQAREEFPEAGPFGERLAGLEAIAARLLVPYRRWTF